MPKRATGNARESSICDELDALGFVAIQTKGSGARGAKMRRRQHQWCGDILAIPADRDALLPWLQIECGAKSAPRKAFSELERYILPGFRALVIAYRKPAGYKKARRFYWTSPTDYVYSLQDAIDVLRPMRYAVAI